MKSLAFFNNKGGVGKTTLLCNMAAVFSEVFNKKVCVVDCDPQCNASQYLLSENQFEQIIETKEGTIAEFFFELRAGRASSGKVTAVRSEGFNVDLVPGHPALAMVEDFLAREWLSTEVERGLQTTFALAKLNEEFLSDYDFVFYDVGPSLGSINRVVLMACDYFVSPMTIDIFSLKAFGNIVEWFNGNAASLNHILTNPQLSDEPIIEFARKRASGAAFVGYVTQQYKQKSEKGVKRPVQSYEKIRGQIEQEVLKYGKKLPASEQDYEIGSIPNLFSLVPMSQSVRRPIFELTSQDGVVGSHFARVKEARKVLVDVAKVLRDRIDD
ncbi:AAA family ATPase [Epibacterium sp. SM1979]|uniref:AAA family ATPase n=1 Tax=Tritonibacter litoralis TaxID=2662264 RepID=A0A843YIS0_9RHOB|nr:AAA family ATPase [Tritonibacter litoralis]MQQ09123.1 AAA family ATPase [Tritonibacter litoralis]